MPKSSLIEFAGRSAGLNLATIPQPDKLFQAVQAVIQVGVSMRKLILPVLLSLGLSTSWVWAAASVGTETPAKQAVMGDHATGTVLLSKEADQRCRRRRCPS